MPGDQLRKPAGTLPESETQDQYLARRHAEREAVAVDTIGQQIKSCPNSVFIPIPLPAPFPGFGEPVVDQPPESILLEAEALVNGPRQQAYDHPYDNHLRIARLWSVVLGIEVTPEQAALCMLQVKVAREIYRPKRDNRVDIAGYALVLDKIVDRWGTHGRGEG